MKNRTLPLSLLVGAALTIPSLAMAAPAETAPADMQNAATATTLEAENESGSNQANPFEISETQSVSRASTNNNADQQQAMQLEQEAMQNQQEPIQQQDPQEAMLQQEALLESQENLQQAPQQGEAVEAL
ncbi:hypothetical protein [Psychrobacter sp. FME5]|uniref:hypothetical protein n=1 Tax=Psychrobacter sp. FME5 TaxID=2487706 RepID=UPI001787EF8D|nr:hypothetical protein [Psychrobacter sp. FME5]MBE0446085.1 hypothetical protein [Psychrobacter sp. FME5]